MCGIVGVIAKNKNGLFKNHSEAFKQMLFADQLRGFDGAGVFYLAGNKVNILKRPSHASSLIVTKEFDKSMEEAVRESPFIIGHNRAATKGNLSWNNTHPFNEGSITLVHNGTLFQHKYLDAHAEVDSHAICKHMAREGDKETLKIVNGAFALVWYNGKEDTLNLCRNSERPLYLIDCQFCYLVCSEAELGQWIATRNKFAINQTICLLPEIKYVFNLGTLGGYKEEKMEFYLPPPLPITYHGNQEYGKDTNIKHHPGFGPMMKATGSTIQFKPFKIGNKQSAVLFDIVTQKHYLYGRPEKELFVHIRVYGDPLYLKELEKKSLLFGTISIATRSHKAITYTVVGVGEAKETGDKKEDEYTEEECKFCSSLLRKDELERCTPYDGGRLCPDCAMQFKAWDWE